MPALPPYQFTTATQQRENNVDNKEPENCNDCDWAVPCALTALSNQLEHTLKMVMNELHYLGCVLLYVLGMVGRYVIPEETMPRNVLTFMMYVGAFGILVYLTRRWGKGIWKFACWVADGLIRGGRWIGGLFRGRRTVPSDSEEDQ
jgi:hypothetical protein